MEWGDQQIQELITTITGLILALNQHQEVLDVILSCVEQLDARSQVTTSAHQSLAARLDKLENVTYGDGK